VKVLAVQNMGCETLGRLEGMLRSDGFDIDVFDARVDHVPTSAQGYHGIFILGGPMAVYDNLEYLSREQELIRHAVRSETPLLGICLGSQLIAQAMGGHVFKGAKKEIGMNQVTIMPDGRADIFRGQTQDKMKVFQWHGDTYDLPKGARILAKSDLYTQAFRIGSAVGLQFHLEVDGAMIRQWAREYSSELQSEKLNIDSILPDAYDLDALALRCQLVYGNFLAHLQRKS
jgi:GMP synthase-like glutamine amidotransferase